MLLWPKIEFCRLSKIAKMLTFKSKVRKENVNTLMSMRHLSLFYLNYTDIKFPKSKIEHKARQLDKAAILRM